MAIVIGSSIEAERNKCRLGLSGVRSISNILGYHGVAHLKWVRSVCRILVFNSAMPGRNCVALSASLSFQNIVPRFAQFQVCVSRSLHVFL